ncbi:MAG: hypothetical protein ACRDK3_05515 [Actinomycetota bacterium]
MSESELPTRRQSLRGVDFEDNTVVLEFSISRKLYKCPGCYEYITVGAEHVLVRYLEPGGNSFHQHWHRACTRTIVRELRRTVTVVPGSERPAQRGRRGQSR